MAVGNGFIRCVWILRHGMHKCIPYSGAVPAGNRRKAPTMDTAEKDRPEAGPYSPCRKMVKECRGQLSTLARCSAILHSSHFTPVGIPLPGCPKPTVLTPAQADTPGGVSLRCLIIDL